MPRVGSGAGPGLESRHAPGGARLPLLESSLEGHDEGTCQAHRTVNSPEGHGVGNSIVSSRIGSSTESP